MSRKLLFIFNPHSGKGKMKHYLYDIVERFTQADYEVTVVPTQKSGDCEIKIRSDARNFELVVVSGGDGTLNEAVTGMSSLDKDDRVPIGYIPTGTMNDFASTNNISHLPLDAVEDIIEGRHIPYDIGVLNDKNFIYVAGFGAFTDVSYETPQINKNILGSAAYFLEGVKSLPKIKHVNVKITTDSGDCVETNASLVLIMNSTSVAGFEFGKFYDIDTSDGVFEIVVISTSVTLLDFPQLISAIRNGKTDVHGVSVITAKEAVIETDQKVKWTLDGEYGGETTQAHFKVNHNAVEFFISENK